jgi:hypothetical protein
VSPLVAFFLGYAVGGAAMLCLWVFASKAPVLDEHKERRP